jgi:hypothetical protein
MIGSVLATVFYRVFLVPRVAQASDAYADALVSGRLGLERAGGYPPRIWLFARVQLVKYPALQPDVWLP